MFNVMCTNNVLLKLHIIITSIRIFYTIKILLIIGLILVMAEKIRTACSRRTRHAIINNKIKQDKYYTT